MTVHSLTIFDRRGKTLFTKTYSTAANLHQNQMVRQQTGKDVSIESSSTAMENGGGSLVNPLDEQRKLVFGMLFSLSELMANLSPNDMENSCKLGI